MLVLPPGFVACVLTGKSAPGDRLFYTWVAELVFDSVVFFATLYRTITLYRRTVIGDAQSLITIIMRDGIMYFTAIFASNLVTVLIFIFAVDDLKVINATFSNLITSLMVSRLMLNLRSEVIRCGPVVRSISSSGRRGGGGLAFESHRMTATTTSTINAAIETLPGKATLEATIIGNLGAPVMTFEHEGYEHEYDLYQEQNDATRRGDQDSREFPEDSVEYGYALADLGTEGGTSLMREPGGPSLDNKSRLTPSRTQTHLLPQLLGLRRIPSAERRESIDGGSADHTRSPPAQLVVQVTEEVVVADESPNTARPRRPLSFLSSPPPSSPAAIPRRTLSLSSPSVPSSTIPSNAFRPSEVQSATVPRPPARPLRSAQALRWIPPTSWRLGSDRDRQTMQPNEGCT
ncbi:hypothetical protein BD414DRAFT_487124 [Trametes punicea]|nr:hypothetical protein BD414DRAFT_487124 [Trametes punicea]